MGQDEGYYLCIIIWQEGGPYAFIIIAHDDHLADLMWHYNLQIGKSIVNLKINKEATSNQFGNIFDFNYTQWIL